MLLVLLIPDSSCGNAAELYIRPDAGIVINRKVVTTIYSAEIRAHPLQSVIKAECVIAWGECRVHHTIIHGWVLGFWSHVQPRQSICIANELSILGHLVFDVMVHECWVNMRKDLVLLNLVILVLLVKNVIEDLFIEWICARSILTIQHVLVLWVWNLWLNWVVLTLQIEYISCHWIIHDWSRSQIRRHWILIVYILLNIVSQGRNLAIVLEVVTNNCWVHFLWIN